MQRLRLNFAKTPAARFTGHLDLFRSWERTIRRANLPLAYSQGFSPHPRMQLAAALPLGFTSQAEELDIWLEETREPEAVAEHLRRAAPPGIDILSVREVELRAPTLQTQVSAAEYILTLLDPVADLPDRLAVLWESSSLPRQRRNKPYDLRPLIEALEVIEPDAAGQQRFIIQLAARSGATGRPEEVLEALGIPAHTALVHRTRLIYLESSSTTVATADDLPAAEFALSELPPED